MSDGYLLIVCFAIGLYAGALLAIFIRDRDE
jgi:hypothetical protein